VKVKDAGCGKLIFPLLRKEKKSKFRLCDQHFSGYMESLFPVYKQISTKEAVKNLCQHNMKYEKDV